MERSLFEGRKPPDETAIRNERAKLTATYLNGLAIAVVAIGFLAPTLAPPSSGPAPGPVLPLQAITGLLCLAMSGGLHLAARRVLGGLR